MTLSLPNVRDDDWQTVRRSFQTLARAANPVLPQARVFNSANISAGTSGAVKVLTFDSERWDEGSLHSTSANTDRLTAPITGLYAIGANVQWASNATGLRLVRIIYSNGAVPIARVVGPPVNGDITEQNVSTQYRLAAGEYVTVEVVQTSGGALNVLAAANTSPEFWMVRLGGYTNQGT